MTPRTNTLNFLVGMLNRTEPTRPARPNRPNQSQHRLGVPLLLELLAQRRLAVGSVNANPGA
ncbi:MAG TPA: hypothetical protein VHC22_32880 [Pirellulales bacterium]|nr:hypothetical protein [Pirellulales bacterium]